MQRGFSCRTSVKNCLWVQKKAEGRAELACSCPGQAEAQCHAHNHVCACVLMCVCVLGWDQVLLQGSEKGLGIHTSTAQGEC
eukprot:1148000-Pelagomonas_calceolata.AAC.7